MSKNNHPPYDVDSIIHSFKEVFESADITKLTKEAYKFCTLYFGFIAHYNHHGFIETYQEDMGTFVNEIANASVDRYKNDSWFENEYGPLYVKSIYDIGIPVIQWAKNYKDVIEKKQYMRDKEQAQRTIKQLKQQFKL